MSNNLKELIDQLRKTKSTQEKINILNTDKSISLFLNKNPKINALINKQASDYEYVIKSLILINQAENVLFAPENLIDFDTKLKALIFELMRIDRFYEPIGGIVGYHFEFIKLLKGNGVSKDINFFKPHPINIENPTPEVQELIKIGLKNLDRIAFICPMGGAGDRLNLFDTKTKEPLPAACLSFFGKTLFERLILDIQALEHLYFKTFNKSIETPIVIMSSDEKDNHKHLISILEKNSYFERSKESFFFIKQISAPVITKNGDWVMSYPLTLSLKPSGHGVLWKLMKDKKAFAFLKKHKRDKAIIRQINNPIASTDYTILAFLGAGIKHDKKFGFASCARKVFSSEGVDVLKEKKTVDGFLYNISNIEYVDFEKYNIKDEPVDKNSKISKYPSNTNILFADLATVEKTVKENPFPGLVINLKNKVLFKNNKIEAGRLEFLMQNISDSIVDFKSSKITRQDQERLKTYLTFSKRNKTISTTKKSYKSGEDFHETPLGCFYDYLSNFRDLLKNHCKMKLPDMPTEEAFISKGPSFICYINPMMGPLYSIISKKIISGELKKKSEMQLDVAEIFLENISIDGSFLIKAPLIKNSKCFFQNVKIKNLGIDRSSNNTYWDNKITRQEYFKVILNENSYFHAKNIEFKNSHTITVPPNSKMTAYKEKDTIKYKIEKI